MTIRVVCKQCRAKMDIRAELAGSTRKCPKCKTEFVVPQPVDETPALAISSDTADLAAQSATPAERAVSDVSSSPEDSAPHSLADDVRPSHTAAPQAAANEEDDDDDDYMPSFLTADHEDRHDQKTPLPPTGKAKAADADDEPVLSIPKIPTSPKPKFQTFDPDEFSEDPTPRPRKREVPASLDDDRPKRTRPVDDFDDEPPRRGSGGRTGNREFNLPNPGSTRLSDPGAGAMSSGTKDRAQAARELRQALKDSALRAPQEPEAKAGIGVDLADFASEIGIKGVAIVLGVVILLPAIYFLSDYVMGGGPKLPKLGYVTGTVTYDGSPTAGATVYFEPRNKEGQLIPKTRTSVGITDEKGQYQLTYMEGVKGAPVGSCRVTIALPPPLFVPAEYAPNSLTMKDVAAGSQTFDFSLTAPPKRR